MEGSSSEGSTTRLRATVVATLGDHLDPETLSYLGGCLRTKYERTRNLRDLDGAIKYTIAAVEATPEGHHDRAVQLHHLGCHLRERCERNGNLQDLEDAIRHAKAAVDAIPEGHSDRAGWLNNLGSYLSSRYERTGDLQDLEAAIKLAESAVEAIAEDHPDRAAFFNNLGSHLSSRYERTGGLQDLEAAIARAEAAVEATPEDSPDRAGRFNNLSSKLCRRYERTGNLQDLEAAIARSEAAVEATPEDHPDRAGRWNNLGNYLSNRYERTGNLQDLEAAIKLAESAVEAIAEDHPDRAGWLDNLGSHLSSRYGQTGNLEDLKTAIALSEAAIVATPEGHLVRAGRLNNLGNYLSRRYQRTGNLQDLEAAIKHAEAAVEATPGDHPDRAGRLNNLGSHLGSRYERTGSLQDLEIAIKHASIAAEATPADHPDRAAWLNNLGSYLSRRYERSRALGDLEAAISLANVAVEATPVNHPKQAGWLNSLGAHLSRRYQRTGNLQDLESAIRYTIAAVEGTPKDHPDRAGRLNNLGSYLSSRYERTGDLQDLEAAINHANAAVEATPANHPDRAAWLNNLGNKLNSRYERTRNPYDLDPAIAAWFAAWRIKTAPILVRLSAALSAVKMLVFNPSVTDLATAWSLLHDATHLIPLTTSRSLDREDQQHILGKLTGLASLAVSVSLEAGRSPLEALRLQELSRSITNGQLLDYRSDISDLIQHHPRLANDFNSLRQELDSPFPSSDLSMNQYPQTQQAAIHRRNKVAQDLDEILLQIRKKPGFENFLLAESEEYLLSAAKEGPIVVLNATELRSDAILLTKTQVTSIPLPYVSHASVIKYFGICAIPGDNEFLRGLLRWLWRAAVQPVLRELGFYPEIVHPLPRIWWIGVGLMAKAPIHAATIFKRGLSQMTTLQYCLPSYTSTIRALQYSRFRQLQCRQNASMLLVTMPTTPGEISLSGVVAEASKIKHSVSGFITVDTLERPTPERVIQALPNYSIAHFACHGCSAINPAHSHLLLLKEPIPHHDDGPSIAEVDKLRVNDIAALKLPAARLAFLSACDTAATTTSELIDEVTHIASSFHIAGFPHVIGTIWPTQDEACQKMAADFYVTLSKTDDVATSYRNAILGLMKQKPSLPMYWAPFIHFGA